MRFVQLPDETSEATEGLCREMFIHWPAKKCGAAERPKIIWKRAAMLIEIFTRFR